MPVSRECKGAPRGDEVFYFSFLDEEVFKGMALLEETSAKPTKEANSQSARTTPVSTPERKLLWGWPKNP